jgi:hypothetical protein
MRFTGGPKIPVKGAWPLMKLINQDFFNIKQSDLYFVSKTIKCQLHESVVSVYAMLDIDL